MKLQLRTVVLVVDDGFVVEGRNRVEIEKAVEEFINGSTLMEAAVTHFTMVPADANEKAMPYNDLNPLDASSFMLNRDRSDPWGAAKLYRDKYIDIEQEHTVQRKAA